MKTSAHAHAHAHAQPTAPRRPSTLSALATMPRRQLVGLAALVAAPAIWRGALAQTRLRPTPAQTEGPYYPVTLPADTDADLLAQGKQRYTKGTPVWLAGTVTDTQGRALQGGVVEIWQCDPQGHYHHPADGNLADPAFQGFGRTTVGSRGEFRFHALRPVPYTGRTPHIHVKVKLDRQELLTTQLYVEGDPGNPQDMIWRRLSEPDRAAVTLPFKPGADGLQASCALVVEV